MISNVTFCQDPSVTFVIPVVWIQTNLAWARQDKHRRRLNEFGGTRSSAQWRQLTGRGDMNTDQISRLQTLAVCKNRLKHLWSACTQRRSQTFNFQIQTACPHNKHQNKYYNHTATIDVAFRNSQLWLQLQPLDYPGFFNNNSMLTTSPTHAKEKPRLPKSSSKTSVCQHILKGWSMFVTWLNLENTAATSLVITLWISRYVTGSMFCV